MFIFKANSSYHCVFQGDQLIHRHECNATAKFLSAYFSSKESKGEYSLKKQYFFILSNHSILYIYNDNNVFI